MSSLRTFNPGSLDLDIYVQDVKGLGRGRGFKVVGKSSALNKPSITQPIKSRVLDLSLMLYERRLLSQEEIIGRFKLSPPEDLEEERDALRADLSDTEYQLKQVEEERDILRTDLSETEEHLNEARVKIERYSNRLNELIGLVADVLDEDSDDWEVEEDGAYAILKSGVERLIESYQALKASEAEEEDI